jgi:predicted transposase/invertase (TIGR01784 family)
MYLDEKERIQYESQQKFWLDQNSLMKEAIEQAVEKAEFNSKIEIAKNAILEGFDNKVIIKLTGLTLDQIEALRKEIE